MEDHQLSLRDTPEKINSFLSMWEKAGGNMNQISDGYHSFEELYEFRKMYNAALFNLLADRNDCRVIKSYKHSDGELCFGGGWFIVSAELPSGQISNHYENKDWDLFRCEEVEAAPVWDGHTSKDVLERLKNL